MKERISHIRALLAASCTEFEVNHSACANLVSARHREALPPTSHFDLPKLPFTTITLYTSFLHFAMRRCDHQGLACGVDTRLCMSCRSLPCCLSGFGPYVVSRGHATLMLWSSMRRTLMAFDVISSAFSPGKCTYTIGKDV